MSTPYFFGSSYPITIFLTLHPVARATSRGSSYSTTDFLVVSDIAPLSKLKRLTYLDLSDTEVSDVSILASLPQLKFVDLQGTKVGKDEISSLSTVLPNCNIAAD